MELERLIKAVADVLDLDPATITADSKFVDDLGADSLDLFEMVMSFEDQFGVKIPEEELENIKTVGDAVKYIEEHK